jgi:Asp-tRNA(Asn)/Glu-tRNA(Gln) amidotransferase A subunit family amidase
MEHRDILSMTARDMAAAVGAGRLTVRAVAEAHLERIADVDGPVMAWQHLDPAQVRDHADRLDGEGASGPLAGVPLGVKDVIETADMPTGYGTRFYDGFQPLWDAPCVQIAKNAGALVMGKTVSTELAMASPNKTRNPHNPAHTPGGSSSGSCAAVAAGMVPLAFGTQTSGSVIRPASFCGVTALKPTFGLARSRATSAMRLPVQQSCQVAPNWRSLPRRSVQGSACCSARGWRKRSLVPSRRSSGSRVWPKAQAPRW